MARPFGPWPDAVGLAHGQGGLPTHASRAWHARSARDHRVVGARGGAAAGGGSVVLMVWG
jgi:hypothetical protein